MHSLHHRPGGLARLAAAALAMGAVSASSAAADAADSIEAKTDWFRRAGYGVFVHFLAKVQNDPTSIQSLGRRTSWDECVRGFDVERFADAMKETGAGYVIFTVNQQTQFLLAPNAAFDRIAGYRPGEACATRDLVLDVHAALARRGIPLMLYTTGDGPSTDPKAAAAFGVAAPVTTEYVRRWSEVLREFSVRYGDKVKGWWVDGCYRVHGNLRYDEEKLGIIAEALRAGNPDCIIAMNNGVEDRVRPYTRNEDFTCGEQNVLHDMPAARLIEGRQWHILSFLGFSADGNSLGAGWGQPGVRYAAADLAEYIGDVNERGGVVSIDVLLYRDGALDRSQLETLRRLRPLLAAAAAANRTPVPPGNLAWRKPGRLLSLDGSRELIVNGGGGGRHHPKYGVDGDPATTALAAGEWPWTYEVDLIEPRAVRRVKVTFAPDGYPTQLRIAVSADGATWRTVATEGELTGKPFACEFPAVSTRLVRVSALKPDGPNQPGEQMAVAELEVYE
jgi:hypothetical protein